MSIYLLPFFILLTFVYAKHKKVNVYGSFISGAKQSLSVVGSIFPYLVTIMIMVFKLLILLWQPQLPVAIMPSILAVAVVQVAQLVLGNILQEHN